MHIIIIVIITLYFK